MFQEYGWLYTIMIDVHNEEGLTFKGIGTRCTIDQIKELHALRNTFIKVNRIERLIQASEKIQLGRNLRVIAQQTYNELEQIDADPDTVLRELQKMSMNLSTTESRQMSNADKDVDEWAEYMMQLNTNPKLAYGLMTSIHDMDAITTGWQRKDFSVVGARTSIGKTAFMLENVLRLNKAGYKTAIFSLEMIKRQMYTRMMANLMQQSMEMLRTGRLARNHYETLLERKNELKGIYVDDTRGISADYIADSMRQLKRKQGLDFVVVDYIQDVKEKGEHNDNGGSAIARICRTLRAAAQECDCHVMGLSQVVREVERREDKRPGSSDLAGSTGIETSADVIAMLYRDDYYNPDSDKKNLLEVNFTKQRNGKLGKVELFYDRNCQRISQKDGRN